MSYFNKTKKVNPMKSGNQATDGDEDNSKNVSTKNIELPDVPEVNLIDELNKGLNAFETPDVVEVPEIETPSETPEVLEIETPSETIRDTRAGSIFNVKDILRERAIAAGVSNSIGGRSVSSILEERRTGRKTGPKSPSQVLAQRRANPRFQ
jgi:hypothetical protein